MKPEIPAGLALALPQHNFTVSFAGIEGSMADELLAERREEAARE